MRCSVHRKHVVLLMGVAALLRVLLLAELRWRDPLLFEPLSDAAYYHRWALLAAGGGEFEPGRPYWLPPLYPWALALLYRITGGSIGVTLLLQAALGVAATGALVSLARRVAGRRAALAAGWLWTLYFPVAFFETRLLAVNLAVPLSLLALLALLSARGRLLAGSPARAPALAAGLLIGLGALARPNLMLAAPAAVLALAWGRRSRAALAAGLLLLAGFAAAVAPAAAYNARTGEPAAVTANGGINFWFGNNPGARGTFHAPSSEWGAIDSQREVSLALAAGALGREPETLGEREASAYWFRRGLDWMARHPGEAARLWALKLADTLSSTEYGIQYVPGAYRASFWTPWLFPLPFGLLLGLAALGWPGRSRGRAVLVAWLLAGLAASLLYFTYSRFRLPLLPALMPFAGRGALRLLRAALLPLPLLFGRGNGISIGIASTELRNLLSPPWLGS